MTYCSARRLRRAKIKEKNVDFATEMPEYLLPLLKTRFEDVGFCNWGKQRHVFLRTRLPCLTSANPSLCFLPPQLTKRRRADIPEALFRPELVSSRTDGAFQSSSLPSIVDRAVRAAPFGRRDELYANVVLAGGTSLIPGLGPRLQSEVQKLAGKQRKVVVHAPRKRGRGRASWEGARKIAIVGPGAFSTRPRCT